MALDVHSNVLVLYNEPGGYTFRCVAYTSNGDVEPGFPSSGIRQQGTGHGYAMTLDSDRQIYLTGRMGTPDDIQNVDTAITTIKTNIPAITPWRQDNPLPPTGRNEGIDIALDAARNVYVAGHVTNAISGQDIVLIKYSNDGTQLGMDIYNGPANKNDVATGIAIDANGNVYVSGYSETVEAGTEFVIIKYLGLRPPIERQPDGVVRLRFQTSPGGPYAIEATTNFLSWENLLTGAADANGVVQFDDTAAPTIPYRFYRGNSAP